MLDKIKLTKPSISDYILIIQEIFLGLLEGISLNNLCPNDC